MKREKLHPAISIALLVLIALLSFGGAAKYAASPDQYVRTTESLEEKRSTVMKLTASASAASIAIAAVPGDATTPIANELAELNHFFIIALCAILLEKYLLSVSSYVCFAVLIPLACLFYILHILLHHPSLRKIGHKFVLLGVCVLLVVPASVKVSDLIEEKYQISSIVAVDETELEELAEASIAEASSEAVTESIPETESENKPFWNSITDALSQFGAQVESTAQNAAAGFGEKAEQAKAMAQETLNRFIEALAVLIVTTCLVPILTFMFFLWLLQTITGVDFQLSPPRMFGHRKPRIEPKAE